MAKNVIKVDFTRKEKIGPSKLKIVFLTSLLSILAISYLIMSVYFVRSLFL